MVRFGYLCCFAALFCGAACETGCPPYGDIAPCTCREQGINVDLQCRNLTNKLVLERVFQNARRYHFNKFTLAGSTLQNIPHTIFDDVEVKYMFIENMTLMNTFSEIPKDPGLKEISVIKVNVLSGWDWKKLSSFKHLEMLVMLDVPLKRLTRDFSIHVPKTLKTLSLKSCQIQELRDDQFVEFTGLKHLLVSIDNVTTIKRSMFPRPSLIESMSFQRNKISSLPDDLFTNMPNLKLVSLIGNPFSVLPENTFKPVIRNLNYLDLREVPIKCDCLFVWLLKYRKSDMRLFGACTAPKRLYGKSFDSLKVKDFNC